MSSVAMDMARRALSTRETLPADPAEWGRAWGLRPGEALKLIREEERKRK